MQKSVLLAISLLASTCLNGCAAAATEAADPMLSQARSACDQGDFNSLFDMVVGSQAVRRAYSAPLVEIATSQGQGANYRESVARIAREQYADFPIAMSDYSFVYAPSQQRNADQGRSPDMLDVTFNQGQNEGWVVEWEQVRHGAPGDSDEEYGPIVARYGDSGMLYFAPKGQCWELTTARVFKHPPGDR